MAIPDFQTLMLPVLAHVGQVQAGTGQIVADMADQFGLSESEREQMLPSGRQTVIANRVHWALSYLGRAGLIDRVARGVYLASSAGRAVLATPPERINIAFLRRYPEFRSLRPNDRYTEANTVLEAVPAGSADAEATPEERIEAALVMIRADLRASFCSAFSTNLHRCSNALCSTFLSPSDTAPTRTRAKCEESQAMAGLMESSAKIALGLI